MNITISPSCPRFLQHLTAFKLSPKRCDLVPAPSLRFLFSSHRIRRDCFHYLLEIYLTEHQNRAACSYAAKHHSHDALPRPLVSLAPLGS